MTSRRQWTSEIPSMWWNPLLAGRNEGDSLVRVLRLAEIDVVYFLAINAEMFESAFEQIGTAILNQPDLKTAMPFIHISAHGSRDGIELSDDDTIYWEKLSKILADLHKTIGPVGDSRLAVVLEAMRVDGEKPIFHADTPKFALCMSSCSAFTNYVSEAPRPPPFQAIVGPIRDVGWCESMLAFSSFYYLTGVLKKDFGVSVMSMNFACGSVVGDGPAFATWNWFEEGEPAQNIHLSSGSPS